MPLASPVILGQPGPALWGGSLGPEFKTCHAPGLQVADEVRRWLAPQGPGACTLPLVPETSRPPRPPAPSSPLSLLLRRMADAQTQAAPLPPVRTTEDLPPPPPKESFSKFHQQRQASELRRLYRHIHPELRRNLAEAVAEDLAEVLDAEEPTEGDVQCMRWIFENWRLDAIGDHEKPAPREPVPGGDVQATSRKFEGGPFAASTGPGPAGGDVRAARRLFETRPLGELRGGDEAPEAPAREPAASGDVRGTRMLFETRPLDRLGSRPSAAAQSPLELRSELQELKGDVKTTLRWFQTEPLCAIQDADGAIHEVKAACREEVHGHAVRSARWLFETQPLDTINRDPGPVRVIRGISLEEGARPDVSATRWLFETQPLDAIREVLVDEKDFQASPDLMPPGPDVRQQRHLFETRALDTLKGDEAAGVEAPPKEEVVPGNVRSTLWLFEMQPLDTLSGKVQVGHLQRVGAREGEGLTYGHVTSGSSPALSLSQTGPQRDEVKGDVKTFKNLFETIPLDSIGPGEPPVPSSVRGAEGKDPAGQSQDTGSPVYAVQDSKGHLHALTSVSREQVVGGDVQGYRWMFETQPLDQLGRTPGTVDVVRGITRQEVVAGDVGTVRWLFETQPLDVIHQRERQERQEEEGRSPAGPPPEAPPKGDVQTIRWLFETCPMSELAEKQGSEAPDPTARAEARSCTWMFVPQSLDGPEGSREQHLKVSQVQAGEGQTDRHVFETEPLQAPGPPRGRRVVRYCSRVDIPSGQVSRHKELFQALEAGKREDQAPRATPEPIAAGSVHKFTWLFENCPMGSLAAESIRGGDLQEEQPEGPAGSGARERQETAVEGTLRTLHATPGLLHHGGILMEARGPGELCLAKYVLPGPGQGAPHIRKEELVSGELPRIVRQVLRRPDVDQQGLLVQEDPAGQLQLQPLRLPGPGGSGNVEDMDPELQQLLACGLGTTVARTGVVMQETEQGLVSLTAYCLQPWLTSRAPERSSVQLLASCIDKGDLSGLHSLRWEPPTDPSPVPASEGAQRLSPTESIIRVPPLDPIMGMGHLRGPGATPDPPRAVGKAVALTGKEKQEDTCVGQTGMAARAKPEGATTTAAAPGAPDLQAAMQSLRMATAEAQSLHQHVLNKHRQGPTQGTTSTPVQDRPPQAPATATGSAHSSTWPVVGGDPRIPAAPRKVSGKQKALPGGLPGGWVTVQDSIYTAQPMRTFDLPGGDQSCKSEPPPRGEETALSTQAPGPLHEGPGQSLRPGQEQPGAGTQKAWGPPEKGMAGVGPAGLRAAETTLKAASVAHHTLASGPRAAGADLHSHNASVPPPPPLPAAVTGPDFPAQARRDEDSIQQASGPLQDPLLCSRSSPAGRRTPEESQTKALELEPTKSPRKKPQLPPKPAHLSQLPPPRRLPKSSALSPGPFRGGYKQGETDAAIPWPAKIPNTAGQGRGSLAGCPSGQSPPSPSTVAPKPTQSQAMGSCSRSPGPLKSSALSSNPASLQQGPSLLGENPVEDSPQGAPERPEIQPESQQELQGLLNQVQALEEEVAGGVDVRALRKLFEAVPQLGGAPQAAATPRKPKLSVEQAFGELTRVSTEVAQLKEQTLARLLDIEEAVHKALSSMSALQPAANPRGHPQGLPKEHRACEVSVVGSSRASPDRSVREARGQTAVKSQTEVTCRTEAQSQAKVRNHTEDRGQVVSAAPSTWRLEMLREGSGPPRVSPSRGESPSSSTFIAIESATRKLPEAPSPRDSPEVPQCTQQAQDVGQKDAQDKEEVAQRSAQPRPALGSAGPLPGVRRNVPERQTRLLVPRAMEP